MTNLTFYRERSRDYFISLFCSPSLISIEQAGVKLMMLQCLNASGTAEITIFYCRVSEKIQFCCQWDFVGVKALHPLL
jgi:hypothetical protein